MNVELINIKVNAIPIIPISTRLLLFFLLIGGQAVAPVFSNSKDAHHKFPQQCSRCQQGGHGIRCHCFKFQLLQYLVLTQLDSSLFTGRLYEAVQGNVLRPYNWTDNREKAWEICCRAGNDFDLCKLWMVSLLIINHEQAGPEQWLELSGRKLTYQIYE